MASEWLQEAVTTSLNCGEVRRCIEGLGRHDCIASQYKAESQARTISHSLRYINELVMNCLDRLSSEYHNYYT